MDRIKNFFFFVMKDWVWQTGFYMFDILRSRTRGSSETILCMCVKTEAFWVLMSLMDGDGLRGLASGNIIKSSDLLFLEFQLWYRKENGRN